MEWNEGKQELLKQKSLLDSECLLQNIQKEATALLTSLQKSRYLGVLDFVLSQNMVKKVVSYIWKHSNFTEKQCICRRNPALKRNPEINESGKDNIEGSNSILLNDQKIITIGNEKKERNCELESAISFQKKSHSCTSDVCNFCQKSFRSTHSQESTTMHIHDFRDCNTTFKGNVCFNEKRDSEAGFIEGSTSEMITKKQIAENCTDCEKPYLGQNNNENCVPNDETFSDKSTCFDSRNIKLVTQKGTDSSMPKEQFSCEECKQVFPTNNHLFQHTRIVHCSSNLLGNSYNNRCEMCGKFVSISNVNEHRCLSNEKDEIRKGMRRDKTLNDAFSEEENFSQYEYRCNDCGKYYFGRANFQRHEKTHIKHKCFKCKICQQSFTMGNYLQQHVKKVHNKALYKPSLNRGVYNADTTVITVSLGEKENGLVRESENSNTTGIPIIKLTGNVSKQNLAANKEIRNGVMDTIIEEKHEVRDTAVTNKNTYHSRHHCSVCGKDFSGRRNLKKHLKTHTKDKIYNCEICGKDFAISDYLTKHMKRHHKLSVSVRDAQKCPICKKIILASYFDFHCLNHKDKLRQTEDRSIKSILGDNPNKQNEEEFTRGSHTPHYNQKDNDEHMLKDLKGTQFRCDTCGIYFPQANKLTVHLNRFHQNNSQKCGICGKIFATMSELKRHITGKQCLNSRRFPEKSGGSHICQMCGVMTHSFGGLVAHARSHINWKECKACGKTFKEKRHLKIHERIHTREMPYSCDICGKFFRWVGNLRDHKLTHTGETTCICSLCGISFASISGLKKHKLRHTSTEEVELCGKFESNFCVCKTCGKVFRSDEGLSQHLQNHESMRNFPCKFCDKQFLYIGELQSHHMLHTKDKHTCAECGVSFKNRGQFFSHLKIHPIEKSFLCQICGKSFSTSHYLKFHTALHKGINLRPSKGPYCCELCGKIYQSRSSFYTHMKIHKNIYDFPCDSCEKKFKSAPELRIHRQVHTKEQPYKCTICDRKFSRHSSLAVHKRTHSEEIQAKRANNVRNKIIPLQPEIHLTGSELDTSSKLE